MPLKGIGASGGAKRGFPTLYRRDEILVLRTGGITYGGAANGIPKNIAESPVKFP